jgi:hypothetical protein
VTVGIIGLVIALGASMLAYLSWLAAENANELAARALELAEAGHATNAKDRAARALFEVALSIIGQMVADNGPLRVEGSGGQLRLRS